MADQKAEKGRARNPYDRPDTCKCSAWSENECGCGGYVDRSKIRVWQAGYDAALRDLEIPLGSTRPQEPHRD